MIFIRFTNPLKEMGPDRSPVAKTQTQQRLQTLDFCSILVVSAHSPATRMISLLLPSRPLILTYLIPHCTKASVRRIRFHHIRRFHDYMYTTDSVEALWPTTRRHEFARLLIRFWHENIFACIWRISYGHLAFTLV
jgi:hypothetical protein